VIGDYQELGRGAEGCIRVGQQPWVHMAVGTDQGQVLDLRVELTCELPLDWIGAETAVRGER